MCCKKERSIELSIHDKHGEEIVNVSFNAHAHFVWMPPVTYKISRVEVFPWMAEEGNTHWLS